MARTGNKKAFCVLEFAKTQLIVNSRSRGLRSWEDSYYTKRKSGLDDLIIHYSAMLFYTYNYYSTKPSLIENPDENFYFFFLWLISQAREQIKKFRKMVICTSPQMFCVNNFFFTQGVLSRKPKCTLAWSEWCPIYCHWYNNRRLLGKPQNLVLHLQIILK
jgi:hypothetical protein